MAAVLPRGRPATAPILSDWRGGSARNPSGPWRMTRQLLDAAESRFHGGLYTYWVAELAQAVSISVRVRRTNGLIGCKAFLYVGSISRLRALLYRRSTAPN